MTAGEFKAWLDGALEFHQGRPTKELLERIKEKAGEVQDAPCQCTHWHWHQPWTLGSGTYNPLVPTIGTSAHAEITWGDVSSNNVVISN